MTTTTHNGAVTLSEREVDLLDRYWRAANYLSVSQLSGRLLLMAHDHDYGHGHEGIRTGSLPTRGGAVRRTLAMEVSQ